MTAPDYVFGRARTLDQAPRERRLRWPWLALLALTLAAWLLLVRPAGASDDVASILYDRAAAHGVSGALLLSIARCESNLDPGAVGDHGHSHGLVQLSDLSTGLLWDFYARGYGSPYSAWESADYLAAVAGGEYAGVRLSRWSCAP